MLHDFFFFVHPVTAFKRGPHGRLVFAKCVLPSVNKVYYYYYYYYYYSFFYFTEKTDDGFESTVQVSTLIDIDVSWFKRYFYLYNMHVHMTVTETTAILNYTNWDSEESRKTFVICIPCFLHDTSKLNCIFYTILTNLIVHFIIVGLNPL